jgi:type II secretory pathway component PulF
MPVFTYSVLDSKTHMAVDGKLEADNLRHAKEQLRNQGQVPIQLQEEEKSVSVEDLLAKVPGLGGLLVPSVGLKDVNMMTQQMHTLVDSGIPLIEALFLLEQQTLNKRLQEIVKKIRMDVIAGDSFSDALARYPREFSRLYTSMIRAGESSGELDRICARLAILLEKTLALKAKIQGAMIYPAVTVLVIIGVLIIILTVVVPQFQQLFSNYGAALPLPTQLLLNFSDFTQHFGIVVLGATLALAFWFNVFRQTTGKTLVDQWVLTMPVLGDVMRKVYVSRFVRTLGTVFGAGVSLTEAITTAAETVDNNVLRHAFEKARDSILAGGTVAKPLEQSGAFPIMAVKMIAIGEETGNMEVMLNKAAEYLDIEVDRAVDTMTTLIEPVMIVVLGGIILGVALALYIPMFEMGKVVSNG